MVVELAMPTQRGAGEAPQYITHSGPEKDGSWG